MGKILLTMSLSALTNKMTHYNPYVQNLIEMGYDAADCYAAIAPRDDVTYPRTIYGRTFETETEYNDAVAEFINGL